jgi:hypothetical protein
MWRDFVHKIDRTTDIRPKLPWLFRYKVRQYWSGQHILNFKIAQSFFNRLNRISDLKSADNFS